MKKIFLIFIILFSIKISCQEYNKKTRYLIGTFHTQNTTINGISLGAFPQFNNKSRFVKTVNRVCVIDVKIYFVGLKKEWLGCF